MFENVVDVVENSTSGFYHLLGCDRTAFLFLSRLLRLLRTITSSVVSSPWSPPSLVPVSLSTSVPRSRTRSPSAVVLLPRLRPVSSSSSSSPFSPRISSSSSLSRSRSIIISSSFPIASSASISISSLSRPRAISSSSSSASPHHSLSYLHSPQDLT